MTTKKDEDQMIMIMINAIEATRVRKEELNGQELHHPSFFFFSYVAL